MMSIPTQLNMTGMADMGAGEWKQQRGDWENGSDREGIGRMEVTDMGLGERK
jgi:hypothetical protein